jgi:dTDP-glucose 4,6-dehydratase
MRWMTKNSLYRDNCRAIDCILRRGKVGEAYNVGAQEEKKNIEVAEKILELLGKPKSLIEFVKDRPGHDIRYFLDCKKIHSLDWKVEKEFFEGLKETVLWYKQNEDWWRKVKRKNREFKKFYREYYKRNR